MRAIKAVLKGFKGRYNAVLNLFTSFGYYNEETDIDVLSQLFDLTASQGILVIDIINRDWLIRHFQTRDFSFIGDKLVCIEERRLNLENSRMENILKYYERHEHDLKFVDSFEVDHRAYSLHELKRLVGSSGWTYQACYGNWNLGPPNNGL